MKRFEYICFPLAAPGSEAEPAQFLVRLNEMGQRGWSMAALVMGWAFMQREIVSPEDIAARSEAEDWVREANRRFRNEAITTGADVCECGHIRGQHVGTGLCLGDALVACPQACTRFFEKSGTGL